MGHAVLMGWALVETNVEHFIGGIQKRTDYPTSVREKQIDYRIRVREQRDRFSCILFLLIENLRGLTRKNSDELRRYADCVC